MLVGLVAAHALEAQPEFEVGDKWTYRFQNTGDRRDPYLFSNQAYRSEAGSGWMYGETQDPNSRRRQFIWRYDYKRGDAKEMFEFQPANPQAQGVLVADRKKNDDRIQFPLTVGKKYAVKELWNNNQGYSEYKAEVEALERVKVEAGEFEAYRIKFKGFWTRTASGSGSGRTEMTILFAPAVKRVIKSEYSDWHAEGRLWNQNVSELVKWEPKAPLASALAAAPTASPAAAGPAPAVPASATR